MKQPWVYMCFPSQSPLPPPSPPAPSRLVLFLWKTFRDLKIGPYAPTETLILQCKEASRISAHIPTSQPDGELEASGHDLHSVSKVFPTQFLELPLSLNVLPFFLTFFISSIHCCLVFTCHSFPPFAHSKISEISITHSTNPTLLKSGLTAKPGRWSSTWACVSLVLLSRFSSLCPKFRLYYISILPHNSL